MGVQGVFFLTAPPPPPKKMSKYKRNLSIPDCPSPKICRITYVVDSVKKKLCQNLLTRSDFRHSPIGEPLSLALENVAILWWAPHQRIGG